MKYDEEEFFSLMAEVLRQGGVYLDDEHAHVWHQELTGKKTTEGQPPRAQVTYCNSIAQFDVPYRDVDKDNKFIGYSETESIKVCAVDDCIGLWPRFAKANAPGRDHLYINPGKTE